MDHQTKKNRLARIATAVSATGIGAVIAVEAATAQLGLIDLNSLLRLLGSDLLPL